MISPAKFSASRQGFTSDHRFANSEKKTIEKGEEHARRSQLRGKRRSSTHFFFNNINYELEISIT